MIQSILNSTSPYEVKKELLSRGVHSYDFQPKQLVFADKVDIFNTNRDKKVIGIYGGAMGGGKTYVCTALAIELAILYPNSIWTILRESRQRCKETVVKDFRKIAKGLYDPIDFNESELTVKFPNGSLIEFKGENLHKDPDLDAFKSYPTNGFFIEQMEEISKKMYEMALLRTGRNIIDPMPPQIILGTINPSLNWVKDLFYDKWFDDKLDPNVFYVPALIEDNKYLCDDKAYMSVFKNLDPDSYARYIEGSWDSFSIDKPFMYCFDRHKHVDQSIQFNPKATLYLSFDFNVDPNTCVIAQHTHEYIYILDELRLRNSNMYEICEVINAKYGSYHKLVTGDASGINRSVLTKGNVNSYTIIIKELRLSESHIMIPKDNPALNESKTLCNALFHRHPNFKIHPRCKYLIEDMLYVQVDNEGKIDKKINKHRSHLLDGLRYYLNSFHNDFIG